MSAEQCQPVGCKVPLKTLLDGAPSSDMTIEKAISVAGRPGYCFTGVVLADESGNTAIVDCSAVRWLNKADHLELMHGNPVSYSANQQAQDKAHAARNATATAHTLLAQWLHFAKDVEPSCPAGADWLGDLRANTEAALKTPPFPPATHDSVVRYRHKEAK